MAWLFVMTTLMGFVCRNDHCSYSNYIYADATDAWYRWKEMRILEAEKKCIIQDSLKQAANSQPKKFEPNQYQLRLPLRQAKTYKLDPWSWLKGESSNSTNKSTTPKTLAYVALNDPRFYIVELEEDLFLHGFPCRCTSGGHHSKHNRKSMTSSIRLEATESTWCYLCIRAESRGSIAEQWSARWGEQNWKTNGVQSNSHQRCSREYHRERGTTEWVNGMICSTRNRDFERGETETKQ